MTKQEKPPQTTAEAFVAASNMPGGLQKKLAAYREHSRRLRPEFAAPYDSLIAHLDLLYSDRIGPAVGDEMPPFLLPNQSGELVALDALLREGPVVVSMHRGHWCPYCKLDLRALAVIEPDIRRLGVQFVSIMPERAQFTKLAIADSVLPFPVLSDVDLAYALTLGLVYWVGAEVKKLYNDIGLDLQTFQGNRNYFLPITAKFIVGRDGLVKMRKVDVDFRQRMEPSDLLDELTRL